MKRREPENLGIPDGAATLAAPSACHAAAASGLKAAELRNALQRIVANPAEHLPDPHFG
jgi:hypothetical protein